MNHTKVLVNSKETNKNILEELEERARKLGVKMKNISDEEIAHIVREYRENK